MIVEGTPLLSAHRAVTVLLILVVTSASQAVFHDDAGDLNANVPNFGHISLSSEIDDFNMTVNPQSLAMHPSSSATSTVEVRSLGSFSGPVSFIVAPPPASPPVPSTASPSYLATTGFSASMRQFLLDVPPGGYATSILTISANASTPFGTYKIILFGYSGSVIHNETLSVSVVPLLRMDTSIRQAEIQQGSSMSFKLTITSILDFAGEVHFLATSGPSGLDVSVDPPTVELRANESSETVVKVYVPGWLSTEKEGVWSINVAAVSRGASEDIVITVITPPFPSIVVSFLELAAVLSASVLVVIAAVLYGTTRRKNRHSELWTSFAN